MPQCKAEYKTPDGIVYCVQEEGHEGKHRAENGGTWAGWSNDEYADLRAEVERLKTETKATERAILLLMDGVEPAWDDMTPNARLAEQWTVQLRRQYADLERELEQERQIRIGAETAARANAEALEQMRQERDEARRALAKAVGEVIDDMSND